MRASTTARGYGWEHQTERKRKLPAAYGTACFRCGYPMLRGQLLDYDHVEPIALGGKRGPKAFSHRRCNRSHGARLGNALRRADRLQTSRRW